MLTTPTTITIGGVAHELSRINQDNYVSVYLKKWALNELRLTIRHSYEGKVGNGQMERHNVDLLHTVWDADGVPSVTQTYSVLRVPRGVDPAGVVAETAGLSTWLTANAAAICAWES